MDEKDLPDLLQEKKELDEKIASIGSKKIQEYAKDLFDNNSDLALLTWMQYTPSFNDGEPCVFTVQDVEFATFNDLAEILDLNGIDRAQMVIMDLNKLTDALEEASWEGKKLRWIYTSKNISYIDDLMKFEQSITDDSMKAVMQSAFGECVRITITKNGMHIADIINHD